MIHIFIINPTAGKKNSYEVIKEKLNILLQEEKYKDIKYEIYETKGKNDATNFAREYCEREKDEELRFYACGGDGTINEVVNGIYGYSNASFSCYPCGSGNDFVKVFKDSDFTDLKALIDGEKQKIDLIRVNGKYCVNITNVGFDAAVAYNMTKFKNLPLVTGKSAYTLGLIKSLFSEMKHYADIYIDGNKIDEKGFLLGCACNGICCGGSYYCNPYGKVDDGIMDCLVVKHMSIFKFLKMVKKYQNGTYLEDEKIMQYINVYKPQNMKIISLKKDIKYGLDGETYKEKEINIELVKECINFFKPCVK